MPPPGGARANPSVPVQPLAPERAAARHLAGRRVLLDPRAARRASRQAAHRPSDAPRRLPMAHGMEHTTPASAGAGVLPAAGGAMTGSRQLRWRARACSRAEPLLPWGDGLDVHMAQPAGRPAEPLHVGAVSPRPRPRHDSASSYDGSATAQRVCLKAWLCTADASTTEELDAGT